MQFLTNEEARKHHSSYQAASEEVYSMCAIKVSELDGLFPDTPIEAYNLENFSDKFNGNGHIFDPYFPVSIGQLDKTSFILESTKALQLEPTQFTLFKGDVIRRKSFLWEQRDGVQRVVKELPVGTRFRLGLTDIRIWILYRWVQEYVTTDLEGVFEDDIFQIPTMEEFVKDFEDMRRIADPEDRSILYRNLMHAYGPFRQATSQIRDWLKNKGELRLISMRLTGDKIYICCGEDVRILSYYAQKEGRSPLCLRNLAD